MQGRNRKTLLILTVSTWRATSHEDRRDLGLEDPNHSTEEGLGDHPHLALGMHLANQSRKDPEELDEVWLYRLSGR